MKKNEVSIRSTTYIRLLDVIPKIIVYNKLNMDLEVLWFEIWTLKVGTAKDHLNKVSNLQSNPSFLSRIFFFRKAS